MLDPIYIYDFFLFLMREEEREKERERNIDPLPLALPQLGTWPAIQVCALTGNKTCDPFGLQAGTQPTPTKPHQPVHFLKINF